MTLAITVIPSSQVVSVGRPAQHPKLIGRHRSVPAQSRQSGLVAMHRQMTAAWYVSTTPANRWVMWWPADVRAHRARGLAAVLERTDHQLCMPELMAAKLAATAPNGGSCGCQFDP
jgi:hypothetical protein